MPATPDPSTLDRFVYSQQPGYHDRGNKVGSTATIVPTVVAGGRTTDALRSITIGHHLFGLGNSVVVHHTNCGTSSFTPQGLIDAYRTERGSDLPDTYSSDSLAIGHLEASLDYGVKLLRHSPAVPAHVKVFGMVFDIDSDEFTVLIPTSERN